MESEKIMTAIVVVQSACQTLDYHDFFILSTSMPQPQCRIVAIMSSWYGNRSSLDKDCRAARMTCVAPMEGPFDQRLANLSVGCIRAWTR